MSYPGDPNAARNILQSVPEGRQDPDEDGSAGRGATLSPRQQWLNYLWSWYTTTNYDARAMGWDGRPFMQPIEAEMVATSAYVPPGFVDAGGALPLNLRRPTAPYRLPRVIVDRFTGMLFSENHHPKIVVDGDTDVEDYLHAIAEMGRLWARFIRARAFGGATGTAIVGFKFIDGRIRFESHDSRWCFPTWKDPEEHILAKVEKRYRFTREVRNGVTGAIEEREFWSRRVITETEDIRYVPVPVNEEEGEPNWVVEKRVEHNFGFCPVVWIQNLPVEDEDDGAPDCQGILDMVMEIDGKIASAGVAISANTDPTVVVSTEKPLANIRTGSDNALRLGKGESATFLESNMGGAESALKYAETLRGWALEVAQCVLDHPDVANRTATEIERVYSSMLVKLGNLREQYGELGIKPLLEMVLKAIVIMQTPKPAPRGPVLVEGEEPPEPAPMERQVVILPPRIVEQPVGEDGKRPKPQRIPRVLDPENAKDVVIKLLWPSPFPPGLNDASEAAGAIARARLSESIDLEHAVKWLAPFFGIEDPDAMIAKMKTEKDKAAQDMAAQGLNLARASGMGGKGGGQGPGGGGAGPPR